MKTKHLILSVATALIGFATLAPTIASAAPHDHRGYRGHKVCHMDRHHHRVCRWVR